MKFVIVTTADDGSIGVIGTPKGYPFATLERAEQVADIMRDPFSAIWHDGSVLVAPIEQGEK